MVALVKNDDNIQQLVRVEKTVKAAMENMSPDGSVNIINIGQIQVHFKEENNVSALKYSPMQLELADDVVADEIIQAVEMISPYLGSDTPRYSQILKALMIVSLRQEGSNRDRAKWLGVSRQTYLNWLKKFGLGGDK